MNVKLTPSNTASQRTKNRIKENGPEFIFVHETEDHISLGNVPAKFFHSTKTEWIGWFPCSEIKVEVV